jgi:hypothetical protein
MQICNFLTKGLTTTKLWLGLREQSICNQNLPTKFATKICKQNLQTKLQTKFANKIANKI